MDTSKLPLIKNPLPKMVGEWQHSTDPFISSREDLIPSPEPCLFDEEQGTWELRVGTSGGAWRSKLGTLSLRGTLEGDLLVALT